MLRSGEFLGFFERNVVAAFESARLWVPAEGDEHQLVRLHRPACEHGDA